ncbi:hypothetical protein [Agrobacterium deltaense]|uniref:hypothetical protein n=1 Tax=Agrobacterium deltaense TaxID=1183412 RepID=UPI001C6EA9F7|nr:hypothetical protein [Agrobacterium deltaense]MBW9072370.1 hypothetical protein [Agrobacterium deltaense]
MASEDSISSGRKSPADSRGDIRMPAQRNGRGCHTYAGSMFGGLAAQYALKDRPSQNPRAACALDPTSPMRVKHMNFSKLYSELPTRRSWANIEFHIDSTSARPPISTGHEMHQ